MSLFTQFKQWIEVKPAASAGGATSGTGLDKSASLGAYFERISGGEPQYSVAEAAQANSRGMVYRTTRFRISELSLENHLTLAIFTEFSKVFEAFRKDGNGKMSVIRVIADGEGNKLKYEYTKCSVIQPPAIDDGDVGRDSEFLMMRIRLQPEALKITSGATILQQFDAADALDGVDYADNKA